MCQFYIAVQIIFFLEVFLLEMHTSGFSPAALLRTHSIKPCAYYRKT